MMVLDRSEPEFWMRSMVSVKGGVNNFNLRSI